MFRAIQKEEWHTRVYGNFLHTVMHVTAVSPRVKQESVGFKSDEIHRKQCNSKSFSITSLQTSSFSEEISHFLSDSLPPTPSKVHFEYLEESQE